MNGMERSSGIDPRYKLGVRLETGDRTSKSNEWMNEWWRPFILFVFIH